MTHFDIAARTWDQDPVRVERANAVAAGIKNRVQLTPRMRALEYGAGTGLLSFALQPLLGEIILADASMGMLEVAAEKIKALSMPNMSTLALDLEKDPAPAQKFDLIYSMMTLHHVSGITEILTHFYSLLQENGYLCIADLDTEDGSFHGADFTGHMGFDRSELANTCSTIGFRNISFDTIFKVPRRVGEEMRSFPVFLMVANKP